MRSFLFLSLFIPAMLAHGAAPQEAYSACRGINQGGACSFNAPHGEVRGTCKHPPAQSRLVCMPDMGRQHPPPAANRRPPGPDQPGQGANRPARRQFTTNQSSGQPDLAPAAEHPMTSNHLEIFVQGADRVLRGNGIPDHNTGHFPNAGNPHRILEQDYEYRIPAHPELSGHITPLRMANFGLAVNGIPFDPGAAEWYLGKTNGRWQYEALSGAVDLGIDENHAHVQPTGAYHYHGLPSMLLEDLDVRPGKHSPLIGWAADGFPIYALFGAPAGQVKEMRSSYQLKQGRRPDGYSDPGGYYDGTFVADYQYVDGAGDLDECNGARVRTPEFPDGTYAYFLTRRFPVIPRCYKGTPSTDFTRERP